MGFFKIVLLKFILLLLELLILIELILFILFNEFCFFGSSKLIILWELYFINEVSLLVNDDIFNKQFVLLLIKIIYIYNYLFCFIIDKF